MVEYPESSRFWAARDAWTAARRAAQAKARGLRVDLNLDAKRVKWEARGERYLRTRPGLHNAYQVMAYEMGPVSRAILDEVAAMNPAVVRALDKTLGPLAFEVWREWPVSSGLSKSLIDISYKIRNGDLIGTIASRAPYTTFIKDQPHRRLISAKMRAQGGIDNRIVSELRQTYRSQT